MAFKFLQTSRLCPEKNFIFGNQSIASSTDIKKSKTIQIGDAGDKPKTQGRKKGSKNKKTLMKKKEKEKEKKIT